MKKVPFVKMSGAGNDFILIDNRRRYIFGTLGKAAVKLCDRKHSIGGDGLILLERSRTADIRMRILNPDGSEAEMCGNGVRALAKFAHAHKITKSKLSIETIAGLITAEVKGDIVKARLSEPKDLKLGFTVDVDGQPQRLNFVNTGVPHVVKVVDAIENEDVEALGRRIRRHEHFAPRGTNVNFIQFNGGNTIRVATYERGVEAETLACGTGSTASALVAASLKGLTSPVSVKTAGGETLKVHFKKNGERFTDVELEGRIQTNFRGVVEL